MGFPGNFQHTDLVGVVYWAKFLKFLDIGQKVSRILDAGCGDGNLTKQLGACAREVIGFDREKRWTGEGNSIDVDFTQHDLLDYNPDWKGAFDVVTAYYVLQHITGLNELHRAMGNLGSYLKLGGRLCVAVPHPAFHHLMQAPQETVEGLSASDYLKSGHKYCVKLVPGGVAGSSFDEYHYPLRDYMNFTQTSLMTCGFSEVRDSENNLSLLREIPFGLFMSFQFA